MSIQVALTPHALPLRPAGRPVAPRGAPAPGTALPHADPLLFAHGRAGEALRQLAAGPLRQLDRALRVPREGARARDHRRPGRRHDGDQPLRLLRRELRRPLPVRLPGRARARARALPCRRACRPAAAAWIAAARKRLLRARSARWTSSSRLNRRLQRDIRYLVRMEPGVQTLRGNAGARERLVPRHRLAAGADPAPPRARRALRVGLPDPAHRRREGARRPVGHRAATSPTCTRGPRCICPAPAGSGLDPTSGLLAGEGHIPLACTAAPGQRRARHRLHGRRASRTFDFEMTVTRIHEDPRVTKPYTEAQWPRSQALGAQVDAELEAGDVRLTHGRRADLRVHRRHGRRRNGTTPRTSPQKRALAEQLLARLKERFAPRRRAALRPGQVVSGRAAAALGARLLLARRRRAAVARRARCSPRRPRNGKSTPRRRADSRRTCRRARARGRLRHPRL